MPNKLTDTEIKKALKEYIEFADFEYTEYTSIRLDVLKNALDLINSLEGVNEKNENIIRIADKTIVTQKAKIEALQMDNAQLHSDIINANQNSDHIKKLWENEKEKVAKAKQKVIDIAKALKTAKTEAYKECLEKVEQRDVSESDFYIMVKKTEFNNLLNELVGDGDGKRKD